MIDLHSHSRFSDGSDAPERLVELAAGAGCTALALTDHDTLEGVPAAAARAGELGLELVPGCEISCAFEPGTMHVLCYFVEPGPGPLQNELVRLQQDRRDRNLEMAERLAELGLPVSYEEIAAEAGGVGIGRPHAAAVLVRKGVVTSINEAFDRYLGKGAPAYVTKARLDAPTLIDEARRSRAVCSLAHPLSLKLAPDELEGLLAELAEAGLVGLECHYGRYDQATRNELARLAAKHGLVATGGSDYHGTYKPDLSLGTGTGDLDVPPGVIDALRARRPGAD